MLFQNDLYWDDWSRMGIFKAPKAGSQNNELIVGRLTGVMDLKIFYKGKNRGEKKRMEPQDKKKHCLHNRLLLLASQ